MPSEYKLIDINYKRCFELAPWPFFTVFNLCFIFSSLIEIVNLFKLETPEMKIVLQKEYEEYKDKSDSYFQMQVIFAEMIGEMDLQKS